MTLENNLKKPINLPYKVNYGSTLQLNSKWREKNDGPLRSWCGKVNSARALSERGEVQSSLHDLRSCFPRFCKEAQVAGASNLLRSGERSKHTENKGENQSFSAYLFIGIDV